MFQVTSLTNNIHDAAALAPDLSTGRAVETMFLFMPGTTPGIFLFVVFGTTAASRQKLKDNFLPKSWQLGRTPSSGGCCFGGRRRHRGSSNNNAKVQDEEAGGGIHVERSLTITSASRMRAGSKCAYGDDHLDIDDDDSSSSDPGVDIINISMKDLPSRPDSARGSQVQVMASHTSSTYMKPLPLAPPPPGKPLLAVPSSKFATRTACMSSSNSNRVPGRPGAPQAPSLFYHHNSTPREMSSTATTPGLGLSAIEEKSSVGSGGGLEVDEDDMRRAQAEVDYYHGGLGPEHSDDSGPILPIQRPEVRFVAPAGPYSHENGRGSRRDRLSKNFSRPRR